MFLNINVILRSFRYKRTPLQNCAISSKSSIIYRKVLVSAQNFNRKNKQKSWVRHVYSDLVMKKIFVIIVSAVLACSCEDTSRNSHYIPSAESYSTDENVLEMEDGAIQEEQEETGSVSRMVQCPMCGGTGIFEFMPGDVMAPRETCVGCNGTGTVTQSEASELINGKNQVDAMFGTGVKNNVSNKSAAELELEIKKAYEALADMEYNREMCTSVTLRPQYDRMIVEQKQWIAKLEAQYYGASY